MTDIKKKIEDKWWQKTIVYQIYPRSFKDSSGNGIGDIRGIINKIDYLEDLGVETIWFSPFFRSPQFDHGYDVSNFLEIDPEYGSMNDFDELRDELHKRNMKILLDLVLNHTSSQHPWFLESASSRDNEKRDWYIWRNGQKPEGKKPPNNWKSMTGGPAWKYYDNTDQWVYFHFLPFQPDLNYRNPEVKKKMFEIVRFWLDKGVDGFRLDIFQTLYENEELRDNPFTLQLLPSDDSESSFFQNHFFDVHLPETFQFATDLRSLIDKYDNPKRFLVGEINSNMNIVKSYYGTNNDGLNLAFLFQFTSTSFNAKKFGDIIKKIENKFPYPYTPTYVLGNHDRMRYITKFRNDRVKARLLATLQLTLRGVPFIYYGEEIGMQNVKFKLSESEDPIGRKFWWLPISQIISMGFSLTRDGCRTPMQWDNSTHAGFTPNENAEPWLRIPKNYNQINVINEENNPESLLNCYKSLLNIRKKNSSLQIGSLDFIELKSENKGCLAYQRIFQNQIIRIYLNFTKKQKMIEFPYENFELLFSTFPNRTKVKSKKQDKYFLLKGFEGIIIQIK
ncbi:MAG: alpha-glucosidase [Candidatus Lokiarchaeota archaeon]|nr:alpha-glucosidase [Candidatus Lokiarchaeota archaeon]MBD3211660.1 alpha-glucosidase [Candidatus Lokiarchaeota archaeon]